MPDDIPNPVPETTGELQDAAEDVTDAMKDFVDVGRGLVTHISSLVAELARLHPVEAAKEIPTAASDVAQGAGTAAGDVAQGAGHAAAAVPAVATDTLDTAQGAGGAVVKKARRYTLRKRR